MPIIPALSGAVGALPGLKQTMQHIPGLPGLGGAVGNVLQKVAGASNPYPANTPDAQQQQMQQVQGVVNKLGQAKGPFGSSFNRLGQRIQKDPRYQQAMNAGSQPPEGPQPPQQQQQGNGGFWGQTLQGALPGLFGALTKHKQPMR